ncbi:MAG: response regulator [Deltaproteobacteria bacterium]|nr:response regulator [Deltaproteobacteria bacterium]
MNLEDLFSPEEISTRRQALLIRLLDLGGQNVPLSERALHIGHKLHGAGGTLGLKNLANAGRELEQKGRDGSATDDFLQGVMEKMQSELQKIYGEDPALQSPAPAQTTPKKTQGPAKVLCVDDTPESLAVMCALMKRLKVEVLRAKSGQEALDVAAEHAPDIVLMDRMMPGISGDDACRQLRKNGFEGPILAVTAMVGNFKELEAPFSGLIAKPLDMMSVMQIVKDLLSKEGFAQAE